jgi:hypothetical protein
MGKKKKPIATYHNAIKRLVSDVPAGTCKIYEVCEFPRDFPHLPDAHKLSKIIVATSGCVDSGHDFMVVCPYRVDKMRSDDGTWQPVHDIDPAIIVLDSDTKSLSPSGLVAFHQSFDGRTKSITGQGEITNYFKTVADLQAEVKTAAKVLSEAPPEVISALQHMAKKIQTMEWPAPSACSGEPPRDGDGKVIRGDP